MSVRTRFSPFFQCHTLFFTILDVYAQQKPSKSIDFWLRYDIFQFLEIVLYSHFFECSFLCYSINNIGSNLIPVPRYRHSATCAEKLERLKHVSGEEKNLTTSKIRKNCWNIASEQEKTQPSRC